MPVYLIKHKSDEINSCGVIMGENAADAALAYDAIWLGNDKQDDLIRDEADDSINNYCESLLNFDYDVTEIHRAMVLEYVERRLDGDSSISILL